MATAISIITDIASELNDTDYVVWSQNDLGGYLNAAQRQISLVRPDASSSVTNLTLVAGTKQTLPSTARRLLDIVRNMGTGSTPGEPIRVIDEDTLNLYRPTWHTDTDSTTVENFVYDEKTPDTFYVYPPIPSSPAVLVEAKLSINPTELTDFDNDNISIDDVYIGPIRHWMMHLAYSKETDSMESRTMAGGHLQAFYAALGLKTQTDGIMTPSVEVKGGKM